MTTSSPTGDAALPPVGTDLQNVHSKPELAHVFQELAQMNDNTRLATFRQMYGHVHLPDELNLGGFQVVGFNPQADHNKGALLVADKDKHLVVLDVDGNEYRQSTAVHGQFDLAHPTALPDQAAGASPVSPSPA